MGRCSVTMYPGVYGAVLLLCLITFTPRVWAENPGDIGESSPPPYENIQNDGPGKPRSNSGCAIFPLDGDILIESVDKLLKSGTKLIRYTLYFYDYSEHEDPLVGNFTKYYKLDTWERVTSVQGHILLSLAFNFDVLSLWLLSFDVEEVDIPLVDTSDCMRRLSEQEKYLTVRNLLLADFIVDDQGDPVKVPHEDDHAVCQQILMVDGDKHGNFTYECCHRNAKGEVVCSTDTQNEWISFMYDLFMVIKLLVLLCGPMMVQRWFFRDPINKADYVVPLNPEDRLHKTILVKKMHMESDDLLSSPHQQREMRQFKKFRHLVKAIPSDEIVSVTFQKLHVLADHQKLMSEKVLPIGIFQYIYEKFLRCGVCKAEPLASCCRESLIGTWGPKFLWFKMFEKSECNNGCRRYISWGHLTSLLGYLILLAVLPFPYILRSICFYYHEEDEIEARQAALDRRNLTVGFTHGLFQYWTPTHGGLITMYIIYAASFLFLVCIRQCDKESCDDHISGAIQDMRGISYLECLRMFSAHLILPFEKFGVCGVVAAVLYYPFALPICALVIICYCVPTVYLTGRLLMHGRPTCLQLCPKPSSTGSSRQQTSLAEGTTSMEACLFLNKINPSGPQVESPSKKSESQQVLGISKQSLSAATYTLLVGVLCILQMFSLLIMYAETIGFLVEGCILVILGAIINADITIRYIIFGFWLIFYVVYCYRIVRNVYARLSKTLFKYIKDELYENIHRCVAMRQAQSKNTAFKFLSSSQIRQKIRNAERFTDSDDDLPSDKSLGVNLNMEVYEDTVNYLDGRLHWTIHGLVLYVDKNDTPHIPKLLFRQVCELDAPGCPGPLHKILGSVVKQLAFVLIFLILMCAMFMVLEEVGYISTTSELLITFASGLLPFFFLYIVNSTSGDSKLNKYSFTGKVHQLIMGYTDTWPVFDLVFKREYPTRLTVPPTPDEEITPPSQASTLVVCRSTDFPDVGATPTDNHDNGDPTHVDLLITIREDINQDYITDNLRSEPGSLGSHGSLNSGHRNSPDDPGTSVTHGHAQHQGGAPGGTSGSMATNKPTNATVSRTVDHGGAKSKRPPVVQNQNSTGSPGAEGSSPRVDLIVDIAKGGLQFHGHSIAEPGKNGIPMWPVGSRYATANDNEVEAAL